MRSVHFSNPQWQPGGANLTLRKSSVSGPLSFLNPTTALYDIKSNDVTADELNDLTDPEKQERAKVRWNARDYRKGRYILVLPRHAPMASRMQDSSSPWKILIGIGRMFTVFPYWDVSWLIGVFFTIGCLVFVACGLFYWLPIAYPETEFEGESKYYGGITCFVGATLFQIGAFLLWFESYNDRAETKFGAAVESLFCDRLRIARRSRHHRPKHFHIEHVPDQYIESVPEQYQTDAQRAQQSDSAGDDSTLHPQSSVEGTSDVKPIRTAEDHSGFDNDFEEREWRWLPSWYEVKTHYIYEVGFLASFTMSLGATIFYIDGFLALPGIFEHLSERAVNGAYYFPYLFGGVLFALSSILYMLETQPNWYTPQPMKIGWYVGVFNLIGGVGWTYAASTGYCRTTSWCEYQSELALIWASASFALGSAFQWYESLDKYVVVIED